MSRPKREEWPDLYLTTLEWDLLTLLLGRKLYSVPIELALKEVSGRVRGFGSIYPTLRSLEKRGLLSSEWGERPEGILTGPRRRYYTTSERGEEALKEADMRRAGLRAWEPASNKVRLDSN